MNFTPLARASVLVLGLASAAAWAQGTPPAVPAAPSEQAATATAPMAKPNRAAHVAKLDTNQDGYLSQQEVQGNRKLAARFSQIDTDKDGRLSREELQSAQQQAKGGAGKAGKGPAFAKLDANGDQMISRDEAAKVPRLARHFDAADTNRDGQVSADEFAAMRSASQKAP